jgi:hypothetical protein
VAASSLSSGSVSGPSPGAGSTAAVFTTSPVPLR